MAVALAALLVPAHPALSAAPVIAGGESFMVAEGATEVATLTASDGDVGGSDKVRPLPAADAGGADRAALTLSAASVLAFIAVTVSDVAETPVLHGPSSVQYPENGALRVAAYTTTDLARQSLIWSLSGADGAKFSIDDGVLRFLLPPNYEAPADDGANNAYAVTVQASDAGAEVANAANTVTKDVTVTVTQVDEAGALTLSSSRPKLGTALTATVSDPDGGVTATTWKWERSSGRKAWTVIGGAASDSYTPTAADAGHFLRVTATYADSLGAGKRAQAVAPNVVLAHTLSQLAIATSSTRTMYPNFNSEVLHYAVGCVEDASLTLTLTTANSNTRLAVNGIQQVNQNATVTLTPEPQDNIPITLSGGDGASTTYVVHCLDEELSTITTTKKPGAAGIVEDLLMFTNHAELLIVDNNGVPRYRQTVPGRTGAFFRVFKREDGTRRYIYTVLNQPHGSQLVVLDDDFKRVASGITVRSPLTHTDGHDFIMLPNGNYVLLSYERAERDFSFLSNEYGLKKDSQDKPVYGSSEGPAYGIESARDSAFQIRTPGGEVLFTWNSWGNVAIEDCTQHRFPDGYGHINSLDVVEGDIVAGLRGCSKVYRIDPSTGAVVWRLGRSNRSDAQWAAGETSGVGPAPLRIVNDPYGEFCGQHAAQILDNGNLLLYDNGVRCLLHPATGESQRISRRFSRAVEYALDPANGEAVFQRHHSLHGAFNRVGYASGHVEALDNGDWLISWGRTRSTIELPEGVLLPDDSATQVDPQGNEKFSIDVMRGDSLLGQQPIRAIPLSPVALAATAVPLTAQVLAKSPSHIGPQDRPQVIAVFNQPVVDPTAATPSVKVQGATITSVSPHVVPGELANAYIFTLAPTGSGTITFKLVANQACASGGICTADGARLSEVVGATSVATATELPGDRLLIQRTDIPGASLELAIGSISADGTRLVLGGVIRDETAGTTYVVVRRASDGRVVRRWVSPDSPLVYQIPWAVVNTQYSVPVGVLAAIPLDDQVPTPNLLVRRFDGGDDRIFAYDRGLQQWRHVPDVATFQALGFYWCNVTAADADFLARISQGPPYPASQAPARADYPSCLTSS